MPAPLGARPLWVYADGVGDLPRSMDRIIDSITLYTIENGMLTW